MVTILGKVSVGDSGTDYQLLCEDTSTVDVNSAVDLSTVDTMEQIFTDPDGAETTQTSSILNSPGTDGIISFVNTDTTFIDQEGVWYRRAKLTFTDASVFTSNNVPFEVLNGVE